ncbi:MAG TPA: glycoside hydrolase family 2 TIM barrel-domain containing protein [Candidatus Hydrogenedentes bacterium]|nr:glycoside hydrolase family 2 TIM barrel-domain containing protein [Candidatus Hydrogenedentota bacterium]
MVSHRVDVQGSWELTFFPEGSKSVASPADLKREKLSWIEAKAPGNVELDLIRAGLLPEDLFFADAIRQLRPLEQNEWWYMREVVVSDLGGMPWDLVFEGLDTLATVWVNDVEVGRAANMFIEHRFDVTAALRPGRNVITVRLGSAMAEARRRGYDMCYGSWERRNEALFLRKAPHMWGWNSMPRAVSAGIWRPAYLEARPPHAITQAYYNCCLATEERGLFGCSYELRTAESDVLGLTVHFRGECGDSVFEYESRPEFVYERVGIWVDRPKLWWPRGYGEANLYKVTLQVRKGDEVLAERVDRIGFRTASLESTHSQGNPWMPAEAGAGRRWDVEPDPAHHWRIIVNGEPIMVKGCNYEGLDAFPSREQDRLDATVQAIADLGCNMVRCWGGAIYPCDRFYDLCDERGIMVWQDFAMACTGYPHTDEFAAMISAEAEAVIKRLRNHTSLVIWCGDNEVSDSYADDGKLPMPNRLTKETLPRALHRHDPYRPYLPSTPFLPQRGWSIDHTPDQHIWTGAPFDAPVYQMTSACFVSEIGALGVPDVTTLRRFLPENEIWPPRQDGAWAFHTGLHRNDYLTWGSRVDDVLNRVCDLFGELPDSLEEFVLASQIAQAEFYKGFAENIRLRKWRASGVLFWVISEPWPQFSDSLIDYYGRKKLVYHYLQRAYRPVCVMVGQRGNHWHVPLVAANDTRRTAHVEWHVHDADSGETLSQGARDVPANQNWQLDALRFHPAYRRLWLIDYSVDGIRQGNHYLAGFPESLDQYKAWLVKIAALSNDFDPATIGR